MVSRGAANTCCRGAHNDNYYYGYGGRDSRSAGWGGGWKGIIPRLRSAARTNKEHRYARRRNRFDGTRRRVHARTYVDDGRPKTVLQVTAREKSRLTWRLSVGGPDGGGQREERQQRRGRLQRAAGREGRRRRPWPARFSPHLGRLGVDGERAVSAAAEENRRRRGPATRVRRACCRTIAALRRARITIIIIPWEENAGGPARTHTADGLRRRRREGTDRKGTRSPPHTRDDDESAADRKRRIEERISYAREPNGTWKVGADDTRSRAQKKNNNR